jgi:ribosomal protein S18 acetylase RimI-like enzyme
MTEPWLPLLHSIAWHSLVGPHAALSVGTDDARRYAPGSSPIAAFADTGRPNFAALAPHCAPGERLYCGGWTGPAPAGWAIHAEATLIKMVWVAPEPVTDAGPAAVHLGPEHVPQMLELVALTKPGPFGPRTIELGDYFGAFDGARLVAMAGERMFAGPLREVSGVCTHPDFQGRGLARRLMQVLVRREMRRGETPFLHVMRDNRSAHDLYERMGFRDRQEQVVRVLSRTV